MIEKDKVGGTCLHRGCIPAKEFLETAATFRHVAGAKEFGVDAGQPILDFSVSQARKQKVVDKLYKGLSSLVKGRKITTFEGTGTLAAGHLVRVSSDAGTVAEVHGRHVVLASGSVPRTIPGFEIDGQIVLTCDEVLMLDKLPSSAVVIGGGAIGCEFASMMADLGVQVTILEALPKILPGCDADVANVVVRSFKQARHRNQDRRPGDGPRAAARRRDAREVRRRRVGAHRPSRGLGRSAAATPICSGSRARVSVVDDADSCKVDEFCRTGEPGVYAVGDLIATPQLAHVGFAEAIMAVKDILGEQPVPVDYGKVPWAIYCHPEVAFAGYSEEAAVEAGYEVVTSKHQYRGNSRALIVGEAEGLVKVIAAKRPDGTAGTILGVHMVGPWVTEQLGQGYLAVNWEATVDEVAHFIQPHPTLSELFGESVLALTGRGLHG